MDKMRAFDEASSALILLMEQLQALIGALEEIETPKSADEIAQNLTKTTEQVKQALKPLIAD